MKLYAGFILNGLIVATGIAALSWGTNGWTTWTQETYRRTVLVEDQFPLPEMSFLNQDGLQKHFSDFDEDIILVDFIFTRCLTQCIAMGYTMKQLQQALRKENYSQDYHFLSISFDYSNDTPKQLKQYLARFSADENHWSALTATHPSQLKNLLNDLGVIVIPEEQFGFIHNTAIYIVKNQKIIAVYDYQDLEEIFNHITRET